MAEHPASQPRPSAQSPAPVEQPTAFAELKISVGPASEWGSASVTVPPDRARQVIQTVGILGAILVGIGGAVLTLSIANGTTGVVLAVAELVLALIAAVLIVVVARTPRRRTS